MDTIQFNKELVMVGQELKSKEEVVHELASRFLARGFVLPSYEAAVLRREASFPTGLPTEPVGVAIPHADPEHCVAPSLGVALLPKTVAWGLIGEEDATVDVSIVFLLNLTAEKQATFLSELAELFQTPENLATLVSLNDPAAIAAFVESKVELQLVRS